MRSSSGGPCCHCATIQTPCWRKGPPEKPTLCNACGSRYLVKGSLQGYFPGARRTSAGAGAREPPHVAAGPAVKGPRKAPAQSSGGVKRKAREFDGQEIGAKRIYNNYEALEELRSFFCPKRPPFFSGDGAQATTSDSQESQERFREEAQYLDASSDDCAEQMHDGDGPALMRALAATTVTGFSGPRVPLFQRRPRKQPHPVPCSC